MLGRSFLDSSVGSVAEVVTDKYITFAGHYGIEGGRTPGSEKASIKFAGRVAAKRDWQGKARER